MDKELSEMVVKGLATIAKTMPIFGRVWLDWHPIIIPHRFLDEHEN